MSSSDMSKYKFKVSANLRLVLVLLIVLAGLLRSVYFYEINTSPFISYHDWEQSDMNFFDRWAKNIAGGDWLTDQNSHPFHMWHRMIAEDYFQAEPAMAQKYANAGQGATAVDQYRSLWNHWYGEKTFHQEPLYAYLIAITYKLFGENVRWVFLWQMILGILNILLVFSITRRHFGDLTAIIAAGLAVLCGPMLYYEMVLLRETLITFLTLVLVYWTDRAWERDTGLHWFGLGIACGAAILLKSTFVLFWLGVLIAVTFRHFKAPTVLFRAATGLLIGLAIAISPAVARNVIVGAPHFSLSSLGSIAFVSDNAVDFSPEVGFNISRYAATIMGKSDGHILPAIIETIRTHSGPLSYLSLLWRKFSMIWHWYEIPDNTNYYLYAQHALLLRYMLTFFLLGPLSVLGLLLAFTRRKSIWPILLMIICNVSTMLVFHVMSRYRVSLIALLLPFSAFALIRIFVWIQTQDFRRLGLAVLPIGLMILWMGRPLSDGVPLIRAQDYTATYDAFYTPKLTQAFNNNDWQSIIDIIKDALRYEPAEVREMGESHPAINTNEAKLARLYSDVYRYYATALRNLGQTDASGLPERRAKELSKAADDIPDR